MKKQLPLKKGNGLLFTILLCLFSSIVLYAQNEDPLLYSQDTTVYGNNTSYRDLDFGNHAIAQSADDFEIPGGQRWVITRIHAPGIPFPDVPDIYPFGGEVLIYVDDNGKPGELIYSSGLIPPGTSNADLDLILPTPVSLEAGVYWLSVLGQSSQMYPEEKWHWKTTDHVSGNTAYLRNTIPIHINITQGDWAPLYKAIPQPPVDLVFTLYGVSAGDAAPSAPRDLIVNYTTPAFNLTWTDNADHEAGYLIERGTDGQSFNVIATVGPDVTTYEDSDAFDHTLRYQYRIAALDSALKSNYSLVAFVDVADTLQAQPYEGGSGMSSSQEMPWISQTTISADDFLVPENQTWTLKKIYTEGSSSLNIHIQKAHVKIFIDSAGFPTKNEFYSTSISLPYEDRSKENMMLTLPEPVSLPSGRYWFSVYVQFYERENYNEEYWYWTATDSIQATQAQIWEDYLEPESNWKPAFEAADAPEGPYDLVFTLFGIDTHMPSDSLTLEAPVATLASFVSSTAFTANWQPVEDATHYELDVFNIQDSVSLPGYENKIVNGTSQEVTGTKSYRRYFYVVRAVNDSVVSENSNAIRVAHIKNLTLRTVCSDTPTVYRRWKVINNNPFPIPVTWNVLNTAQSGTHLAAVGESFFVTETVSGLNKTMIAWYDDEQVQHISIKSSTYNPCQSDKMMASGRRNVEEELNEEESPFMVAVYPNPVKDKLTILLSTPLDGMVSIELLNLNGQRVYAKEALGNTIQEIDATSFSPGIFILKAKQGQYQRAIKIVKQ